MERQLDDEGVAGLGRGHSGVHRVELAHEQLRVVEEERHVYGALFENAPEAYLTTDLKGVVTRANRRAFDLFNLERSSLCRKPLALLIALADRPRLRDLIGVMTETVLHTELRLQLRTGEGVWASVTASRAARDEVEPDCIRWLFRSAEVQGHEDARRDATHEQLRTRVYELEASQRIIGHLLEREQAARQEADAKTLEKEQVLAEVAHELRGPLGTIAGWLHMMGNERLEEGVRKRAVLSMTRGTRTLSRIIEELIEHARFERHQVTLKPELLSLVRTIVEVMEDLRPLASLKDIRLELVAKTYTIPVYGDAFRLQQVARNLIGNAIKFTPDRGLIHVELDVVHDHAQLTVSDTGRGIERDAITKIFEPFAQVGLPAAQRAGLGLGLSIAKRLVELHGGTICAESAGALRGATFRVCLPLAER